MEGWRSALSLTVLPQAADSFGRASGKRSAPIILLALGLSAAIACNLAGCRTGAAMRTRVAAESQQMLDQARIAESRGRNSEAAEILTSAVRLNPDDAELQCELARILMKQGNTQAAIDRLRGAVSQKPEDIRCYVQLADTLFQQGAVQDAEPPLDTALGINPCDVDALFLKARVAEAAGRRDDALETYYRVLAVEPDHVDARLAVAAIHLSTSRCECAAALLRSIAASETASPTQRALAQRHLGRAYFREGRWDAAARELAAGLTASPEAPPEEWYELAYSAQMSGRRDLARSALSRTLLINPKHRGAMELAAALDDTDPNIRHASAEGHTETGRSARRH